MMKKNIATRITYECEKCKAFIEVTIPYTFSDGARFPWSMDEVRTPECPMQYAKTSGYPSEHVIQWKSSERVKEE